MKTYEVLFIIRVGIRFCTVRSYICLTRTFTLQSYNMYSKFNTNMKFHNAFCD